MNHPESTPGLMLEPTPASAEVLPEVVDHVAVARLYGEPLFALPQDLYIPPDALEVFLEAFEGPLDLLLYLIRKQNFNILDIPMAAVTRQYLSYVDEIRARNLELAAEYLLMAAMLIEIKSRMLLPPKKTAEGEEPEDPRAELVRRLLEYEQMKLASSMQLRSCHAPPDTNTQSNQSSWCEGSPLAQASKLGALPSSQTYSSSTSRSLRA